MHSGLVSEKGVRMPGLTDAMQRFFTERAAYLGKSSELQRGVLLETGSA